MSNGVGQNSNIISLDISYWTLSERHAVDLAWFIKNNRSLKQLSITFSDEVLQQGLITISGSLTSDNSLSFVECSSGSNIRFPPLYNSVDMNTILKFLEKLKCANSLKLLFFSINIQEAVGHPPRNDHEYQEVERSVQEINSIRNMKGIDPLLVMFRTYTFNSANIVFN